MARTLMREAGSGKGEASARRTRSWGRTGRFPLPASRFPENAPDFRHADRHRQNDDPLQHLDDLLGDEGVDGEAALAEGGEEERGEDHAPRVVAADEGDGDAEEAGAAG